MMITSLSNPQIKFLRSLNITKFRNESGQFLIEGLKLVGQAFDSHANIQQLIYSPELLISEYGKSLIIKAKNLSIDVLEISATVFQSISRKDKPQGIAALVNQNWQNIDSITSNNTKTRQTWVAIEAVQNPGNLGTVLRTCDATGVSGLLLLPYSTDPYDPAAVKASMGAIFTIPIYNVTYTQLYNLINRIPKISVIGTSDKAEQNAFRFSYPDQTLLLIGSEREGLSAQLKALCNHMVRIPMVGSCDSLNLSVATGIILYEIFNQYSGLIR